LRIPPILWSLLGLLACLGCLIGAASGRFTVRQVRVVGANVPSDAVVSASGLVGQNIFTVQSDSVVRRLSSVREIAVRRVETDFPDTVTIYALMRTPLVAWRDGKALYELDPEGRIIRQVTATSLPIVIGPAASGSLGPGVVQAVRYAVVTVPHAPNGAIATLRFEPRNGLTITGRAGWTAVIGRGRPQTMVDRIATLSAVLVKVQARPDHLVFVDLRYRSPFARFSGA
jgi:cell division septal protein FtsQ